MALTDFALRPVPAPEKSVRAFYFFLAALPCLAVLSPRLAGYVPGLAGVVFLAYEFFFLKQKPLLPRALIFWLAALLCLALASTLWALDPAAALRRTGKIAPLFLGGAALFAVVSGKCAQAGQKYLWLVPAFYALAAALIAGDLWFKMPLYRLLHGLSWEDRARPTHLNRSVVFCTLLYVPVISLIFLRNAAVTRRRRWLMALAVTMPLALVLIQTASQTALFCLLTAFLAAFLFPFRFKAAWLALAFLMTSALLTTPWLAIALFHNMAETLDTLPVIGKGGAFAANRLEIWDYISRYLLTRPFYGFGVEATRAVEHFDSAQLYQPGTAILHPHNFAIQLWMEFGAIGALLGAGVINSLLWAIYKTGAIPQQRAGLAALAACLAAAAVSYGLWQGWWLGLLFLVLALMRMATLPSKPA